MGTTAFQTTLREIPVCTGKEFGEADAVIIGTPIRFGNMCGQMRQFLDATGGLWTDNSLVGERARRGTLAGEVCGAGRSASRPVPQ
jgi:NAD(P)H dehydrogenase (quinone)